MHTFESPLIRIAKSSIAGLPLRDTLLPPKAGHWGYAGRILAMLTVIGEALVDVVNRAGEPSHAHPGGSPMNVAVGAARLGHSVDFIGRFGSDAHGSMIAEHLAGSQVNVPVDPDSGKTSVAQANISDSGAAEYEFDLEWSLDSAAEALALAVRHSTAVHTGSIAAMLEPGAHTVLETVRAAAGTALISYDPNCRPTIISDVAVAQGWAEAIVPHTDLIKASDEDLQWLYPERSVEDSARDWLNAGAALVLVTRGGEGIFAVNAATAPEGVEVSAATVEVADTVGAGDSLMAALIAYLLDAGIEGAAAHEKLSAMNAEELKKMMNFAATAAGITVSRAGANPPTREELNAALGA